MAEKISWNYVTQALNVPSVSGLGEIEVDAYDKFEISITAGATQQVNLAPGGTVSLLDNASSSACTATGNEG